MCYTIFTTHKSLGLVVSAIFIKNFEERVKDINFEGMQVSPGQLPCILDAEKKFQDIDQALSRLETGV